ncbi:HTH domain-containing protein [Luteolibacter sp. AS25]|uniref:HTH domain-containing protein n=1 Tax=Luteolibacter sp. AS25 TaxID=3135776 RepID=UPI00398B9253
MGRFLQAAFQVLKSTKVPLGPVELADKALKMGILWTEGKTPSQTMKSKISTDILSKGKESAFMRVEKGKFSLRDRGEETEEYFAKRYKKKPLKEDILAISRKKFRQVVTKRGVIADPRALRHILINSASVDRMSAEKDRKLVQLVSFFLVRRGDRILTHKRTARLPEKSLNGVYSLGFGGHMNLEDIDPIFAFSSPIEAIAPAVRELNEELHLPPYESPQFVGLIFDDSNPTSRLHVGLVFEVALPSGGFEIGERGNFSDVKLETLASIRNRLGDFESWSRMLSKMNLD